MYEDDLRVMMELIEQCNAIRCCVILYHATHHSTHRSTLTTTTTTDPSIPVTHQASHSPLPTQRATLAPYPALHLHSAVE